MSERDVYVFDRLGENGEIAVLRTNRPEHENRTNWEVISKRADAYSQLADDPNVKVYIITGTGDFYDTGGELNAKDPEERRLYQESIDRFLAAKDRLEARNIPKIAAVNGKCVAGGMSSVIDADFAIAVETATFGYPEILRGGFPIMAMENALDYIPYRPLIEAMYFGELHDAKWMLDLHLVNCVTTKEEFWPTVMRYAQKVVSMPSDLIQRGRQAYFDMIRIPRGPARIKCAKDALKDILVIQGRHQKGNISY